MQLIPVRASYANISSADHFLYLPSIGFFFLLVIAAERLFAKAYQKKMLQPKIGGFLIIAYFVYLGCITLNQNIYATNMFAMYKETLVLNPDNLRVRNSMGVAYAMVGHLDDAEYHLREVLRRDAHFVQAQISLGNVLRDKGRFFEALQEYEKIINPGDYEEIYRDNLAYVQKQIIRIYTKRPARGTAERPASLQPGHYVF